MSASGSLHFSKMHGLGNDFVVVDATVQAFTPDAAQLKWLCDRHRGVGADQVLVLDPPGQPDVDFDYRIYNADGSPSGQCGNGARCLMRFIEHRGLSDAHQVQVRTSDTTMRLRRCDDGPICVELAPPALDPAALPSQLRELAAAEYRVEVPGHGVQQLGLVQVGNPHAVLLVDDVEQAPVEALGRALQAMPLFPASVNVGFLQGAGPPPCPSAGLRARGGRDPGLRQRRLRRRRVGHAARACWMRRRPCICAAVICASAGRVRYPPRMRRSR